MVLCPDRVFDGKAASPLEGYEIVVEGGRIRWVGPMGSAPLSMTSSCPRVALPGKSILPGFIDPHVHLTWSPTTPMEELVRHSVSASNEELIATSIENCQAALCAGVTAVRDCGGRNEVVFAIRDDIARGSIVGPRVVACGLVLTTTGGHCYCFGEEANSVPELINAVRKQAEAGAEFIKLMVTPGGAEGSSNHGTLQYSLAQTQAVTREARRLGLAVAAHCHSKAGAEIAAFAGVLSIEHCSMLDAEPIERDEIAVLMRERGIYASITNASMYRYLQSVKGRFTQHELRKRGWDRRELVASWASLKRRGVRIVTGTDAGGPMTQFSEYSLSMELLIRELGFTPMEAIEAGTSRASPVLGLGEETGALEPGKVADFVVLDGNPLQDTAVLRNIEYVVRGGEIVVDSGKICRRAPVEEMT